jgi:predicted metal-binding membrane protein
MVVLMALGAMSIAWMSLITVLILAQKPLPDIPPSTYRWR